MECPYRKDKCVEKECTLWMEMFIGDPKDNKTEGKCCHIWTPILIIETKQAIEKVTKIFGGLNGKL